MKPMMLAAAAAAMVGLSALPAAAQDAAAPSSPLGPITGYGTLGYAHSDRGQSDLGAVQGRLGLRFGQYVGAELEGAFGVTDDHSTRFGPATTAHWNRSVAAYVVGYAPIMPKLDLFARVGLGNTKTNLKGLVPRTLVTKADSINYGVGAQYFLTPKDGVRADWTYEDFRHGPGKADTFGLSYVRRF